MGIPDKLSQPAPLTFPRMKVGIILNGEKRMPPGLESASPTHGLTVRLHIAQSASDASEAARNWCSEMDVLVACGGDGTLHHVVNGMMQFRKRYPAHAMPAVAVLPLGTGNDYARHFGWKEGDVASLWMRIMRNTGLGVDVGEIQFPQSPSRYFVNIADAGLGAHVTRLAERLKRRVSARFVFSLAIVKGLLSYRLNTIHLQTPGESFSGKALTAVVAIGHTFGDGVHIAPGAHAHDGFFRVVYVGNVSVWQYLRYLPALRKGKRINHPEIRYCLTDQLTLEGQAGLEADGEAAGELPARFNLHHHALRIIV